MREAHRTRKRGANTRSDRSLEYWEPSENTRTGAEDSAGSNPRACVGFAGTERFGHAPIAISVQPLLTPVPAV